MAQIIIEVDDVAKKGALQKLAQKADLESLKVLAELVESPKACETLKKKKAMIKAFL
jgi:hypothetical protein